jgi:hypothetical protein
MRADKKDRGAPSEFGGRPGLVQLEADGHVPTPAERRARFMRETDVMDPTASGEDAGEKVQ